MNADPQVTYKGRVMAQLLTDLSYPRGEDGRVLDTNAFKAVLAQHLMRAGWRKPNNTDGLALIEEYDEPEIKARKMVGPGVYEDAIEWVPFDAPDDPLADLQNMTIAQINALPEHLSTEAKRRLGMLPNAPQPTDLWSVKPTLTITDAEEADEPTTSERSDG